MGIPQLSKIQPSVLKTEKSLKKDFISLYITKLADVETKGSRNGNKVWLIQGDVDDDNDDVD